MRLTDTFVKSANHRGVLPQNFMHVTSGTVPDTQPNELWRVSKQQTVLLEI
jgi:hypothetical protein